MRIGIIGTGSFGTTMAIVLASNISKLPNQHRMTMFVRRSELLAELQKSRVHPDYPALHDVKIPDLIEFSPSLADTLDGCTHIVFGVPSRFAESSLQKIKGYINCDEVKVISLVKGFHFVAEKCRLLTMSSLIGDMLNIPMEHICALGGPNLYKEIASNYSSCNPVHRVCNTVISSASESTAKEFQSLYFSKGVIRAYRSNDILGTQICGALKNIIALMVGIGDGYKNKQGMGRNFTSSLITRAAYEISYFVRAFGGHTETAYGIAGLGDMIATSLAGRSYEAGVKFAELQSIEKVRGAMAPNEIEAFHTLLIVKQFLNEIRNKNPNIALELPIIEGIYDIVYSEMDVDEAVNRVINRPPKKEMRTDPYVQLD